MGVMDAFKPIPFSRDFLPFLERLFHLNTGHDHDGVNSKLVTVGTPADGSVSAAKLDADLTAIVEQARLMRRGQITLNGVNPTPVRFVDTGPASILSDNAGPYNLVAVGDGGTILADPNGDGEDTATFNFAKGHSVSGANPYTDLSTGVDKKFTISVDGDELELVELTLASCDTGDHIAAELQTKIQALGGTKAAVTVDYNVTNAGKYTIFSGTYGTGSAVVIDVAPSFSCAEELKLGVTAGGTETAGTGDVANAAAATAEEIAAVITADIAGLTATVDAGKVRLTSDETGIGSSLVMGNGTLNNVIGFTNAETASGAQALGYAENIPDTSYYVTATIEDTNAAGLVGKCLCIADKTVSGFNVYCETAAAADKVNLLIM